LDFIFSPSLRSTNLSLTPLARLTADPVPGPAGSGPDPAGKSAYIFYKRGQPA